MSATFSEADADAGTDRAGEVARAVEGYRQSLDDRGPAAPSPGLAKGACSDQESTPRSSPRLASRSSCSSIQMV